MKNPIEDINGWLYHRILMCIWKQLKIKTRNLVKLGVSKDLTYVTANSRRGYWLVAHTMAVKSTIESAVNRTVCTVLVCHERHTEDEGRSLVRD